MRHEDHDLHGTGAVRCEVYDMPGSGWEAVTGVPCPVRGCKQTVMWYEAGYVPGYRVCMREIARDDEGVRCDLDTIRHHFIAGRALGAGEATLIRDRESEGRS